MRDVACPAGHANPPGNSFCGVCGQRLDLGPAGPAPVRFRSERLAPRQREPTESTPPPVAPSATSEPTVRRYLRWQHLVAVVIGVLAAIHFFTGSYSSTEVNSELTFDPSTGELEDEKTLDCGSGYDVLFDREDDCREHRGVVVVRLAVAGVLVVGMFKWGDLAAKRQETRGSSGAP